MTLFRLFSVLSLAAITLSADSDDDFESLFSDAPKKVERAQREELAYSTNSMTSSQMPSSSDIDNNYPGRFKENKVYAGAPNPINGVHFEAFAELLIWDSGSNTYTAILGSGDPYHDAPVNNENLVRKMKMFDTHFQPGIRVGVQHGFAAQGWDLMADYLYFHNNKSQSYSTQPTDPFVIFPAWPSSNFPPENSLTIFSDVTNTWGLTYNQADIVFGKEIYFSKYYSLRPNFGVRYVNLKDNFKLVQQFGSSPVMVGTISQYMGNNLSAGGFTAGLDNKICLGYGLFLVSNLNLGLIYGSNHLEYLSRYELPADGQFYGGDWYMPSRDIIPVIDARLDFGWQRSFFNGKQALSLTLGYEYHVLVNGFVALTVPSVLDADITDAGQPTELPTVQHSNLFMQGFNIGVKYSF